MPRPYRPLAFGNRFIEKSIETGIEHMKVQKLTYLAYGWWLAFRDSPIIDEQPQVWKFGPVFNSMYFALQSHGSRPIFTIQQDLPLQPPPIIDIENSEALGLIDWVWERYGDHGSFYLSDLTHQKDTPWYVTAERFKFSVPKHLPIPIDIIKDHYRQLAKQNGLS